MTMTGIDIVTKVCPLCGAWAQMLGLLLGVTRRLTRNSSCKQLTEYQQVTAVCSRDFYSPHQITPGVLVFDSALGVALTS